VGAVEDRVDLTESLPALRDRRGLGLAGGEPRREIIAAEIHAAAAPLRRAVQAQPARIALRAEIHVEMRTASDRVAHGPTVADAIDDALIMGAACPPAQQLSRSFEP